MIDVDWSKAPEGADEIVCSGSELRWANKSMTYFVDGEGESYWIKRPAIGWQTIATRPEPRKTVKDAVEFYGGELPQKTNPNSDTVIYDGFRFFYVTRAFAKVCPGVEIVCTRKEFEAEVARREDVEWTHINQDGIKLKLLVDGPDEAGEIPVLCEDGYYRLPDMDDLKLIPAKPTITKAEAWDIIADITIGGRSLQEEYEIID